MEENKTKYIESSLVAFRAIRAFVFQKGAYPKNFDNDFWKEEDYQDSNFRRSMREEFEQYAEMLATVNNTYVNALYEAMPHIESEYNNLVINSRNMEQAVKLFKGKFEEVMFVIEWQLDINKTLGNYLCPLLTHNIISSDEADAYQDIICNIGLYYCQAVNVVCDVFDIERPWNKNRPDSIKIEATRTESTEDGKTEGTEEGAVETEEGHTSRTTEKDGKSATNTINRKLPSEFANYFNAPFRGFGGSINYYEKLEDSLTDPAKKRSCFEYAKIALFIYQSKKILPRKKPNTFRGWYQYFCEIVGCEYKINYSPHKLLPISKKLKEEFEYLLD